jgi:hypothetical protein
MNFKKGAAKDRALPKILLNLLIFFLGGAAAASFIGSNFLSNCTPPSFLL